MNKLATIIIPAYNCQDTIERCLRSIIDQKFIEFFDVIVVDNGSTDSTLQACYKVKSVFDGIILRHINNPNVNEARLNGLSVVKTPYVCFVDSDDYVAPEYCKTLIDIINNRKSVQIISFDVMRHNLFKNKDNDKNFKDMPSETVMKNKFKEGFYLSAHAVKKIKKNISFNMNDGLWAYCFSADFIREHYCDDSSITRGEDTATVFCSIYNCKNIYISHSVLYHYFARDSFTVIDASTLSNITEYIRKHCIYTRFRDRQLARLWKVLNVTSSDE